MLLIDNDFENQLWYNGEDRHFDVVTQWIKVFITQFTPTKDPHTWNKTNYLPNTKITVTILKRRKTLFKLLYWTVPKVITGGESEQPIFRSTIYLTY